jgi:putative transposase
MDAIARPREECTVARQTVRLHNRFYYAEALALYDANKVDVEYDLHHDGHVWVFDKKGRFVVEAKITGTVGVLPTSRLEEGRDRRLQGQIKRLERKTQEAKARRNDPIDAASQGAALEALRPALPMRGDATEPLGAAPAAPLIDLDLTNWRKD